MAGVRSLLAFWLGGAGQGQAAPTAGFKSPLAVWLGGAGAVSGPPAALGGFQSFFAFWMGGGGFSLDGQQAPSIPAPFDLAARKPFVDPDEELLTIMAAIMPHVVDVT